MRTASLVIMVILILISFVLIFVSFLLAPDSNSFSGALVGNDLDLFKVSKERGVKKVLKWSMYSLGTLLFILAIVLRVVLQKG